MRTAPAPGHLVPIYRCPHRPSRRVPAPTISARRGPSRPGDAWLALARLGGAPQGKGPGGANPPGKHSHEKGL